MQCFIKTDGCLNVAETMRDSWNSTIVSRMIVTSTAMVVLMQTGSFAMAATPPTELSHEKTIRRPIDLAMSADGTSLYVVNESSGTLSIIDVASRQVRSEFALPGKPSAVLVYRQYLLVTDLVNHQLLAFKVHPGAISKIGIAAVSHSPVSAVVSLDGKHVFVTSLWSHRWSSIRLGDLKSMTVEQVVDLEFAPRHQLPLDDRQVMVTDAFGGKWVIIDRARREVSRRGRFDGSHNLTGMALNAKKEVVIPHMTLNHEKPTTRFNVHWGDVMLNVVRNVPVRDLQIGSDLGGRLSYLGHPDSAVGDPTGILITKNGRQIICFAACPSGISDPDVNYYERVKTGKRPIAMALSADESELFVANYFDDSISVIDVEAQDTILKSH